MRKNEYSSWGTPSRQYSNNLLPLFEGLWIEGNWDWTKKNPVVHLSFNALGYAELGLAPALAREVAAEAELPDIALESETPGLMLSELVYKKSPPKKARWSC